MNEVPTLVYVGKASEVILGIASVGTDLDGAYLPDGFEFGMDEDEEDE